METKSILALARECILQADTQPIQEFNDILEDFDLPRIDKRYIWVLYTDDNLVDRYFSSLEAVIAWMDKHYPDISPQSFIYTYKGAPKLAYRFLIGHNSEGDSVSFTATSWEINIGDNDRDGN